MKTEKMRFWNKLIIAFCVPLQGLFGAAIISTALGGEPFPNGILGMVLWTPVFVLIWIFNEE